MEARRHWVNQYVPRAYATDGGLSSQYQFGKRWRNEIETDLGLPFARPFVIVSSANETQSQCSNNLSHLFQVIESKLDGRA